MSPPGHASGPLAGVRVVELAGIGPAPYACMLMADAGADVIRLERPTMVGVGSVAGSFVDLLARSRPSTRIDLKRPEAVELVLDLVASADVFVEGYRPGVAERLGVGPEPCLARNERLVYGRMTGWGQDGPMAQEAGHDLNYIALSGVLWPIGRGGEVPVPPLNLVGDYGGGGMVLAFGICAALVEARTSGRGQVVDAAMVDGAASLGTAMFGMQHNGVWRHERGTNVLDSGAPFYEVYETRDGRYLSAAAIEPPFYAALIEGLGLDDLPEQMDRARWPEMKERFAAAFATRTRDEWVALFAGRDACIAPVLSPAEVLADAHLAARQTFVEYDGVVQPAPVPRFSRTPAAIQRPPGEPGADTDTALAAWGVDPERIAALRQVGAVA